MKITTDPMKLSAALKAVREFVSEDSIRESSLQNIYVEALSAAKLRLTATDGRTLCSVTIDGADVGGNPARLTPIAVDTLLMHVKANKHRPSLEFSFEDCTDAPKFPDCAQVIPDRVNAKEQTGAVVGVNAVYLARLAVVQKAIKASACRIQFGQNNAPMRVDMQGTLADALVIVMPMRLNAAELAAA